MPDICHHSYPVAICIKPVHVDIITFSKITIIKHFYDNHIFVIIVSGFHFFRIKHRFVSNFPQQVIKCHEMLPILLYRNNTCNNAKRSQARFISFLSITIMNSINEYWLSNFVWRRRILSANIYLIQTIAHI